VYHMSSQEVRVETEKATVVNPLMDEFVSRLEKTGYDEVLAKKLSMWNAFVMEARSYCVKLLVTLENVSFNMSPFVSTSLAWLILSDRIPETSTICPGFMRKDKGDESSSWIPQLFIRTRQPEDLIPGLKQIWGDDHPFAQPELVTDLQAMPLNNLSDCMILNQVIHLGRVVAGKRRSAPYPLAAERTFVKPESVKAQRELELDFKNFEFVSEHPARFLKWAVTKEIRDTVYPQVISMLKSDSTKLEYTRISDEEAERVSKAQEDLVKQAADTEST